MGTKQSSSKVDAQHVDAQQVAAKLVRKILKVPIEILVPEVNDEPIKVDLPITKALPPLTGNLNIHLRMTDILKAPIHITVPRSIDMTVVKLTPPPDVIKDLLEEYDELLAYWGDYLKSLPNLPMQYESCIDKVHKEALANTDFKTKALNKEPKELQHHLSTEEEIGYAWDDIRDLPQE